MVLTRIIYTLSVATKLLLYINASKIIYSFYYYKQKLSCHPSMGYPQQPLVPLNMESISKARADHNNGDAIVASYSAWLVIKHILFHDPCMLLEI